MYTHVGIQENEELMLGHFFIQPRVSPTDSISFQKYWIPDHKWSSHSKSIGMRRGIDDSPWVFHICNMFETYQCSRLTTQNHIHNQLIVLTR